MVSLCFKNVSLYFIYHLRMAVFLNPLIKFRKFNNQLSQAGVSWLQHATGRRPFSWPLLVFSTGKKSHGNMIFSWSNVALCTLQLPACEEGSSGNGKKNSSGFCILGHSFRGSFFWGVRRKVQEQQAYFSGILCVFSSFLSHKVVSPASVVGKTEPKSGSSIKGFKPVSYLLSG